MGNQSVGICGDAHDVERLDREVRGLNRALITCVHSGSISSGSIAALSSSARKAVDTAPRSERADAQ